MSDLTGEAFSFGRKKGEVGTAVLAVPYLDLRQGFLEPADVARDEDEVGTLGGELDGCATAHAL